MRSSRKTLNEWLLIGNKTRKNIKAWILIHLCFGFYHEYGPFLTPDDVAILVECANSLLAWYQEDLSSIFMTYLYHWIVGQHGHLPANQSYQDEVDHTQTQLENGAPTIFFLIPSPNRNAIPCSQKIALSSTESDPNLPTPEVENDFQFEGGMM